MNVNKAGNDNTIQYRTDAAAAAQNKKAEQAQEDQKQAQVAATAQNARKTEGVALKGGEINITA